MLENEWELVIREECSSQRTQRVEAAWRGGARTTRCLAHKYLRFFLTHPFPCHFSSDFGLWSLFLFHFHDNKVLSKLR